MREVVICVAVRSAVGKSGRGSLKDTRPDDLLGQVMKGALALAPGLDPAAIDDVVIGTATPEAEQGMNVARIASFLADLPDSVPAVTINRFCSSGLQSLAQAAASIAAGWQDIALTGGVESMSVLAMGGQKPSPNPSLVERRPEAYTPMGITAEIVATKYGISRTLRVMLDLMTVKFLLSYSTRPLQMFGPVGMLAGGTGTLVLAYLSFAKFVWHQGIGDRPLLLFGILLVVTGVQLVSFGLLAELQSRTYHESQGKAIYVIRRIIGGSDS